MIPGDKVSVQAGAVARYPGQVLYGTVVQSVEVPRAPVVDQDGWGLVQLGQEVWERGYPLPIPIRLDAGGRIQPGGAILRFPKHQFGREMVLVKWGPDNWDPPHPDEEAWWPAGALHCCDGRLELVYAWNLAQHAESLNGRDWTRVSDALIAAGICPRCAQDGIAARLGEWEEGGYEEYAGRACWECDEFFPCGPQPEYSECCAVSDADPGM